MSQRQQLKDLLGPDAADAVVERLDQLKCRLDHVQPLEGGETAARVVQAFEQQPGQRPRKVVIKAYPDGGPAADEALRCHYEALTVSTEFTRRHLVEPVHEPIRFGDGGWVLVQAFAGDARAEVRPLSALVQRVAEGDTSLCSVDDLATACGTVAQSLLDDWAPGEGSTLDLPDLLGRLVGRRNEPGGSLDRWLREQRPDLLDPGTLCIDLPGAGRRLPNPVALLFETELSATRAEWTLLGPSHADLHPGNVLVPLDDIHNPDARRLRAADYRLIDLDAFERLAPLVRDPVHLLLSIVNRRLPQLMAGNQGKALLRALIDPSDGGSRAVLPGWLEQVIATLRSTHPVSSDGGYHAEWRPQTMLALVGCGLVFAGRRTTAAAHRPWFLWLAAEAASAYLGPDFDLVVAASASPTRWGPGQVQLLQPAPAPESAPTATSAPEARPQRRRRLSVPAEQCRAADELADLVKAQWKATVPDAVRQQRLPVLWDRNAELDGSTPATPPAAADSGATPDIFPTYCRLPGRRLVILGGPGAGKTTVAVDLVLQVLTCRKMRTDAQERAATVAVPVILTPLDWDPDEQTVVDWLVERLLVSYPQLRSRRFGAHAAARLVHAKRVALVLDGLDDMPEDLRSKALEALDDAGIRQVILCRTEEMVEAARSGPLSDALVIELQPVATSDAVAHLAHWWDDPLPDSWRRLLDGIRADPGRPAGQALTTPLMIGLARDTYGSEAVDELLDTERFPDRTAVEEHLLGRVLHTAYPEDPRRGRGPGRAKAQRWLEQLARGMHAQGTRDLAWWRLPAMIPSWRHTVLGILVTGVLSGVMFGAIGSLGGEGPALGLIGFLLGSLGRAFDAQIVARDVPRGRRAVAVRILLGYVMMTAEAGTAAGHVLLDGATGSLQGFVAGVLVGGGVALPGVMESVRALGFHSQPVAASDSPLSPLSCWRRDGRNAVRYGAVLGGAVGLTVLAVCLVGGRSLRPLLVVEPVIVVAMTAYVVALSLRGRAELATWLNRAHRRGPFRLVRFLEQACDKGVLRRVGPVYQFRHALLQDALAEPSSGAAGGAEQVPSTLE